MGLIVGASPGVDLTAGGIVPRNALPARIGLSGSAELFFAPVARTEWPHLRDPDLGGLLRLVDGDVEVAARPSTFADSAQVVVPAALGGSWTFGDRPRGDVGVSIATPDLQAVTIAATARWFFLR